MSAPETLNVYTFNYRCGIIIEAALSLLCRYRHNRDWSKKFGVSTDELKAAVKAAGTQAKDVEAYLKKKK